MKDVTTVAEQPAAETADWVSRFADDVIEQFLVSQDSESGLWPNDSDLHQALRDLPLYRLFKRDRLQRLLLAFEQHLT